MTRETHKEGDIQPPNHEQERFRQTGIVLVESELNMSKPGATRQEVLLKQYGSPSLYGLQQLDYPSGQPVETGEFAARVSRFGVQPVPLWRDALDRLFALIILIATLPITLVVALLVRIDSPGPVLFRQWRVGKGGRLFRFTKFRTYYADAKERFPELYAYKYDSDEIERLQFKVPNDPRATRMGAWLRESTVDELPNFWHVVTGEMALIGPRPEIPEMLQYYSGDDLKKFTVRPGVSGAAQVSGRGLLGFRETIAIDVAYVEQRSFALDLRILFTTVFKVLLRQGAF